MERLGARHLAVGHLAPEVVEEVELARLGIEHVDDDVNEVDQHPLPLLHPLRADGDEAVLALHAQRDLLRALEERGRQRRRVAGDAAVDALTVPRSDTRFGRLSRHESAPFSLAFLSGFPLTKGLDQPMATTVRKKSTASRSSKKDAKGGKSGRMIYYFGAKKCDGDGTMKAIIGGKGANLAQMTKIGLPVPPGFTITTEACRSYLAAGKEPAELRVQVTQALRQLEDQLGRRLGDRHDPLLVSVRSGAKFSMPGMMETVLNIGLNDGTSAGQTVMHAHVHIIPRRRGDVVDPRGGVRWIIPGKAQYWGEGHK